MLRTKYPVTFEARFLALLAFNKIYSKKQITLSEKPLADFQTITPLLDIDYNYTFANEYQYTIQLRGLVYQASLNALFHAVKADEDVLHHFQCLLNKRISKLVRGDGYVKQGVFFPPLFHILAQMDEQQRDLDDPRYNLLIKFINDTICNKMFDTKLLVDTADLNEFLRVVATLRNIEPFYPAIEFACRRLSVVPTDIFNALSARLRKENRVELLGKLTTSDYSHKYKSILNLSPEEAYSDLYYRAKRYHEYMAGPDGEEPILTDFFLAWTMNQQQGLDSSNLISLLKYFREKLVKMKSSIARIYIKAADLLLEFFNNTNLDNLGVFLEIISRYKKSAHSSIVEEAEEYFRKVYSEKLAEQLKDEPISLKRVVASVLSGARVGGDVFAASEMAQQAAAVMFSNASEQDLESLETALRSQLPVQTELPAAKPVPEAKPKSAPASTPSTIPETQKYTHPKKRVTSKLTSIHYHYSHANRFHLFKARYEAPGAGCEVLDGDKAKAAILFEFKDRLDQISSPAELEAFQRDFKRSPALGHYGYGYNVLATGQGVFTTLAKKVSKHVKTSSEGALKKMFLEKHTSMKR